jgi:hypothetical protein
VLKPGKQRDSRRILVCSKEDALDKLELFFSRKQFAPGVFVNAACLDLSPVGLAARFALPDPAARWWLWV